MRSRTRHFTALHHMQYDLQNYPHVLMHAGCYTDFSIKLQLEILRVHSFGMIQIRINDPRSLGSWCINGSEESLPIVDSIVPLMHYDPSDLGSLIPI